MNTKIAKAKNPYEGAPKLNIPKIYGASPNSEIIYRMPVTGKRPIRFFFSPALPNGISVDDNGIIRGKISAEGEYKMAVTAENSLGSDSADITFRIAPDGVCRTPLLGFTSWNVFRRYVTPEKIKQSADLMLSTGLACYGYSYVNIDSGWQGEYNREERYIVPNSAFPDMKELVDCLHSLGLKAGIYSTPMQKAWGGGEFPGCTAGKVDIRYPDAHYGIGMEHYEKQNVKKWTEWGFDYVKYDWAPCDVDNAKLMKDALLESGRDYAFCVTVRAGMKDAEYWKNNCSSWRDNEDSYDNYDNLLHRFSSDDWAAHCNPGHFFDLDMLETGYFDNHECGLTEDEQLMSYSMRVLFPSPIQISCDLSRLSDFDLAMLCNVEIIAVNQDPLGKGAVCLSEELSKEMGKTVARTKVYARPLADGTFAVGFFNLGETDENMKIDLSGKADVRDLWAKEDLGQFDGEIVVNLPPHTVRVIKVFGKLSERYGLKS